MKDASEPPTWLAENVTNKRTQTLSRYSKERTKNAPGENIDNNLADMIYGYVNSQLNEMAYDAPVKKLKGGIDSLSAGNKANIGAMNDGIDYMRELVQQAVNPARKNPLVNSPVTYMVLYCHLTCVWPYRTRLSNLWLTLALAKVLVV
jgi:hypothetical protein